MNRKGERGRGEDDDTFSLIGLDSLTRHERGGLNRPRHCNNALLQYKKMCASWDYSNSVTLRTLLSSGCFNRQLKVKRIGG